MYINNIDIKMIMKLGRSIYIPWYRCKPDNESRVYLNQDSKGQGPDNRNTCCTLSLSSEDDGLYYQSYIRGIFMWS
jgi:hypothetical protein